MCIGKASRREEASFLYQGKKILIMGLGLNRHGSGTEAALYLAAAGAHLTITDLRTKEQLAPTIALFNHFEVTWCLGCHRQEDFDRADLIIKNPGVRRDSPFLASLDDSKIETDLSLFFTINSSPLIAVTGSKGKSSIVTSMHSIYEKLGRKSFLGGNITVSPLSFVDELTGNEELILELSSWQLGDLRHKKLLHPAIALITNLMHDHQNYYDNSMESYAKDKAVILEMQEANDWAVLNADDHFVAYFMARSKANIALFSVKSLSASYETALYLDGGSLVWRFKGVEQYYLKPRSVLMDENLLALLLVLLLRNFRMEDLLPLVPTLKGADHRMELVGKINGRLFYNDSAATIPEATAVALKCFPKAHLIVGGADKELNFSCLTSSLKQASSIALLSGSAQHKLEALLRDEHINYGGAFDQLDDAVSYAYGMSNVGEVILLSPAATSFGMFLNEFDRGNQFKEAVKRLKNDI